MSACAKFKIASFLLFSGRRLQRFSTGSSNDGGYKKGFNPTPTKPDSKLNYNHYKLIKDKIKDRFVSNANGTDMEFLFSKWVKNPNSVHTSWQKYFTDVLKVGEPKRKSSSPFKRISKLRKPNSGEIRKYLDRAAAIPQGTKISKPISKTTRPSQPRNQRDTEKVIKSIGVPPPTQTPQDPEYVVGHIILSPAPEHTTQTAHFKSEKKMPYEKKITSEKKNSPGASASKKIQKLNRMTGKGSKIDLKKLTDDQKHQQALERVKAALKEAPFRTKREYIRSQLRRITKLKKFGAQKRKMPRGKPSNPSQK